jgi:cyclophilin family peptidyl-prolyl cis-trans isomerase
MKMKKILVLVFALCSIGVQAQNFVKVKSKKDYLITINTRLGDICLILYNETPLHKENFLKLTKSKFYDSTTFHRVIKGFMIQGGDPNSKDNDPNNDGMGGPNYTIPAEFNAKFTHVLGAVAAARMGDQVNPKKESSGSQFYIVENADGTHFLDNNYTVFGQVIQGLEVVSKIASDSKNQVDRPNSAIVMKVSFKKMSKKKITKKFKFTYPK